MDSLSKLGELVLFVARSLTDQPEAVKVEEESSGSETRLRLTLPPEELGKVIGKQGRIARAIRAVLNAAASKNHARAHLEIVG